VNNCTDKIVVISVVSVSFSDILMESSTTVTILSQSVIVNVTGIGNNFGNTGSAESVFVKLINIVIGC